MMQVVGVLTLLLSTYRRAPVMMKMEMYVVLPYLYRSLLAEYNL